MDIFRALLLAALLGGALFAAGDGLAAPAARVTVTARRLSEVRISPLVFGNFIESGFGRQVSGLWSEMLYNRSFQDPVPYRWPTWQWLGLDEQHYNASAPFWHSGYEEFDWEVVNPEHCRKRRTLGTETFKGDGSLLLESDGAVAGVKQRGVYVETGRRYRFAVFGAFGGPKVSAGLAGFDRLDKAADETRTVTVSFRDEAEGGKVLLKRELPFRTIASEHAFDAEFGTFTGRVTVELTSAWKGQLILAWTSMMPADNVKGWRRDVVENLKRVAPSVIRFPGGCFASFADWRDAVGPRPERRPVASYYWGGLEENDVGIDEFLDLCEAIGCEPQYCVNMMTSTPFRAAELVEYCNGPDNSAMGRLRKLNGVSRRRRVTYWEMDNEAGRKWSAVDYARKVVEFAREMRRVDPKIHVMMEYYSWEPEWLPAMLDIAGKDVNAVIHRDGSPEFVAKALPVLREYNRKHGTAIRLVNTEWLANTSSPGPLSDPEVPQSWQWEGRVTNKAKDAIGYREGCWFYALNAADRLLDYQSYGGEFHLANFNNCVNTWGQNVIEASREGSWLSPAGRVFAFFTSDFRGNYPLATKLDGAPGDLTRVVACEDRDGEGLTVYMVNRGTERRPVVVSLPEGHRILSAEAISAPDRLSRSGLGSDCVRNNKLSPTGDTWELPPLSVTKLRARKKA